MIYSMEGVEGSMCQAVASVKQCYNKGLHATWYMLGQRAKQPYDAWHGF